MKTFIAHTASNVAVAIDGLSIAQAMEAVAAQGIKIGRTSLGSLMRKETKSACGCELMEVADKPAVDTKANEKAAAATAKAAIGKAKGSAKGAKASTVKSEVVADDKTKPADAGKVETAPAVPGVKAIREGSLRLQVFQEMCAGATIDEMCKKLNFTHSQVTPTVNRRAAKKGYTVERTQVEGRGEVVRLMLNGKYLTPDQLVTRAVAA